MSRPIMCISFESRSPICCSLADCASLKGTTAREVLQRFPEIKKLHWTLDRCRELYNAGVQERRDAYEIGVRRHPNYYDDEVRKQLTRAHAVGYYEQKRALVDIKAERPEYQEIASHVLQDVILRLKHAFDNFFRRVQNAEHPGYPRFQGRNRYDSFTYPDGAGWKLEVKERPADKKGVVRVNLKLTKIGTVKLHLHRKIGRASCRERE